MALTVNTDTYISIADCSTYLAANYLSTDTKLTAWTALTDANKEVCLRKAARIVDRQPFVGFKETTTQLMEFPRYIYTDSGMYNVSELDVRFINDDWFLQTSVPNAVKYAQCEIALELAQGSSDASERSELQAQGVKSFSLGKLSETYSGKVNPVISSEARSMLAIFSGGGGFKIT